jgi:flagellar protein FliL
MSSAAATADAPPAAPKGKKKLLIIIIAVVLLLVVAGGAAVVLLKKKPAAEDDGEEAAQVDKSHSKHAAAKTHDPKHPPTFSPLEPFTVNLADRESERFAQVTMTLELADPAVAEQIKVFMPAIRNNILMVLAHKTSAQILVAEGKTELAGQVQRAASRALGVEVDEPETAAEVEDEDTPKSKKKKKKKKAEPDLPITAVLFSNFIVQ